MSKTSEATAARRAALGLSVIINTDYQGDRTASPAAARPSLLAAQSGRTGFASTRSPLPSPVAGTEFIDTHYHGGHIADEYPSSTGPFRR